VEQLVTPARQGFGLYEQDAPALQAWQEPPLQTAPVPQLVPFGLGTPSTQTAVPVEHEVTPSRQTLGFPAHASPTVQDTHAPALQTRFVPQGVPSGRAAPSSQVADTAQEVTPTLQSGSGFVEQARPAVHSRHAPAPSQKSPVPQGVVEGLGTAVSTHTWAPVVQEKVPTTQGFGFVEQVPPATHPTQAPALHTWSAPQGVPAAMSPVSTQTGAPLEHSTLPVLQGDGVQAAPWTQPMQPPEPLQTWSAPQAVPGGSGTAALSRQTDCPVVQDVSPVRQASGLSGQARPTVQATQALW
jgi:hypothetical protein